MLVDEVGFIPILSSNDFSVTYSFFSKRCSARVLVFLMADIAWGKK